MHLIIIIIFLLKKNLQFDAIFLRFVSNPFFGFLFASPLQDMLEEIALKLHKK